MEPAQPGAGVLTHRHQENQVLIAKGGEWEVVLNQHERVSVRLTERDILSVPAGAWRSIRNVSGERASLVVVTGGDGRVALEGDDEVVQAAADAGVARDANGYVASAELVARTRGR